MQIASRTAARKDEWGQTSHIRRAAAEATEHSAAQMQKRSWSKATQCQFD